MAAHFIPLLSSFACAIPGHHGDAPFIDNKRDRLTTILVAPLMTCSARIPVYTLIISAFIPDQTVWGFIGLQGLVMFGLYAAGIFSAASASRLSTITSSSCAAMRRRRSCWNCPITRFRSLRGVLLGLYNPRHDVPEARRHHDLLDDGADLVPGLVPEAAGGC